MLSMLRKIKRMIGKTIDIRIIIIIAHNVELILELSLMRRMYPITSIHVGNKDHLFEVHVLNSSNPPGLNKMYLIIMANITLIMYVGLCWIKTNKATKKKG